MSGSLSILDLDPAASTPVIRGTLGGSLETVRVAVPADVRVVSDRLEWIPVDGDGRGRWWPDGGNAPRALGAFIKLATERRVARFEAFVRRYGVLGLTPFGVPACGTGRSLDGPPHGNEPWRGCAVSWEPIAGYRHYAAGAKAMLCLATALKQAHGKQIVSVRHVFSDAGLPTDERGTWDRAKEVCRVWQEMSGRTWEDWWEANNGQAVLLNLSSIDPASVAFNFEFERERHGQLTPAEFAVHQRQKFGYWLTEFWLKRAGLVPTITWAGEQPQLGLSVGAPLDGIFELWPPNSLFRVLAAHLAAIVCSSVNTATCSNCGDMYLSQRKVRSDQPHYCDVCRPTAHSRRTQRSRNRRRTNALSAQSSSETP